MNGPAQVVFVAHGDPDFTVRETASSTPVPAKVINNGTGWAPEVDDSVLVVFVKSTYWIVGGAVSE